MGMVKVLIAIWALTLMMALGIAAAWQDPGVRQAKALTAAARVAAGRQQHDLDVVFGGGS